MGAAALFLTSAIALTVFLQTDDSHSIELNLITYPQTFDSKCNYGRAKLYDECGSQIDLFNEALGAANEQGKVLLVSYGAEWCIWCHVFDEYLTGSHTVMNYQYSNPGEKIYTEVTRYERPDYDPEEEAEELRGFSAENFVLVHIEDHFSPDGFNVLEQTLAVEHDTGGLPFIFTVTRDGEFAASLNPTSVETRRDTADWYRGYDRNALIVELSAMIEAAR